MDYELADRYDQPQKGIPTIISTTNVMLSNWSRLTTCKMVEVV